MTKEEYNKNRPTITCPICGKDFTKANYNRHYLACSNPNSKLNLNKKKDKYMSPNTTLNCLFCGKLFKNRNALVQHELRCKNNPNRKNYDSFSKYIKKYRKGKNKNNCKDIAKQVETTKEKHNNGYISPLRGKKRAPIKYLYSEHNAKEIDKWIKFTQKLEVDIPKYETYAHNKNKRSYVALRKAYIKKGNTVKIIFEHDLIANIYLNNTLNSYNTVHHIDNNPTNNDISNLMVFETNGEHKRFHNSKYAWLIYNEETHKFNCILKKDNIA